MGTREIIFLILGIYAGITLIHLILITAAKAYTYANTIFAIVTLFLSPVTIFATISGLIQAWYALIREDAKMEENLKMVLTIGGFNFVDERHLTRCIKYMKTHLGELQHLVQTNDKSEEDCFDMWLQSMCQRELLVQQVNGLYTFKKE